MSQKANITIEEARKRVFMYDIDGLLVHSRAEGKLAGPQANYAKSDLTPTKSLVNAIEQIKPTALIGASGCPRIFTAQALQKMAEYNEIPIIFALSNPTSKAECSAEEAYINTNGRCLFSSGSPFQPVSFNGKTHYPGQGNNAYIFPGVALATIVCAARHIEEEVFLIAAEV
jgi:malate dehydrogenase (oxaloacetate-decarboxylating)(NADP+)